MLVHKSGLVCRIKHTTVFFPKTHLSCPGIVSADKIISVRNF